MLQEIAPIAVRPSLLNGLSEQMVVSHYEDTYGNAVRMLNAVRGELATLDADTPPHRLPGLKREELSLMGPVALHELYFANLGGYRRAAPNSGLGRPDWHEVPDAFAAQIAADFGSVTPPGSCDVSKERTMLLRRPNCECCNTDLPPDSPDARICSFECTYETPQAGVKASEVSSID